MTGRRMAKSSGEERGRGNVKDDVDDAELV